MSGQLKKQFMTSSAYQTKALGSFIGKKLQGGEIIELVGDMGSGKTTLVKGIASGLGSHDLVHSPSFVLMNQYTSGNLSLNHFDFHRLIEPGIMRSELAETLAEPNAIVVIEWPGIVNDILPEERLTITLEPTQLTGRNLTLSYPESLERLIPETI